MKRKLRGMPLEQVRPQVVGELLNRAKAERFEAYLAQVRDRYKVDVSLPRPQIPRIPVSVDDDPYKGPEDAPITIVQFAEFQCQFCGRAKETIDKLLENYPTQIRMVFRDFPLGFHDRAVPAAVAANCAGSQGKYFEMYDLLMTNQRALSDIDLRGHARTIGLDIDAWIACRANPEQTQEVMKDMADGAAVGVTGTPAFFVNGIMVSGAQPYSAFEEIILRELANQG
jgi:protein-disulfide isomerase